MEACACVWTQQLKRLELKAPPLAAPSASSPLSPREYRQSQPGQGHVGAQPGPSRTYTGSEEAVHDQTEPPAPGWDTLSYPSYLQLKLWARRLGTHKGCGVES